MKKFVSTVNLMLVLISLDAQVIQSDRRVNWRQIIQGYTYIEPENIVSILDFGGVADGKTDNSGALKKAIASFQHPDF